MARIQNHEKARWGAAYPRGVGEHPPPGCEVVSFLQLLLQQVSRPLYIIIDNDTSLSEYFKGEGVSSLVEHYSSQLSLCHLPLSVRPEPPVLPETIEAKEKESTLPSLSDTDQWILSLYRSLLDFQYPLNGFLSALNERFESATIIDLDLDIKSSPLIRSVYRHFNLDTAIELNSILSKLWPTNPMLKVLARPGDICSLNEIVPRRVWHSNDYCRSLFTHDFKDVVGLCFSGEEGTRCGLFLCQYSNRPLDRQTRQFLLWLRPHLEVAMEIAVRHWRDTFTVRALEEATDHLEIAALVLDGNGRVIKCSGGTRILLEQKHYVEQINQRLKFHVQGDQRKFEQAVNKSIEWRRAPLGAKPVEAMRFTCPPADPSGGAMDDSIGVLVQPIAPPTLVIPHAAVVSPHVIVYISNPDKQRQPPQHQLIVRLFNLSQREAYLTRLLTDGHTLSEAATAINVTQATARTYLQHIYEKVGVNRRQDLRFAQSWLHPCGTAWKSSLNKRPISCHRVMLRFGANQSAA